MKIFIHSDLAGVDDQVINALQKLAEDQSKRRSYFHPLRGFENLSALSIPGTGFKGRIILKHHGDDEYELVLIDHGHQYSTEKLKSLAALEKRESLKELFAIPGNEDSLAMSQTHAEVPAYNLRGKIIIPTDEQWALSEHINSFVEDYLELGKHILVEGVPGAGKTLTIEVAIENFIRSGIKYDGVRKTLFYVAPSGTNLLDKMRSHIQSLPNGREFLDRGLIELHYYDTLVKMLSDIPQKAYSQIKMMFLLDEVQAAKSDHLKAALSCGNVVGFGDMNQAIQAGRDFADLAAEAARETDEITLQILSESLRCPTEVMEFAKLFLSERNKQAKKSGIKQRSYIVSAEKPVAQYGEHVKFYDDRFLDSLSPVSTQLAYVTFNKEQKAKLIADGKINVFEANEIAGLEFDHVVLSLDARELSTVLSSPQGYNLFYMVSTRALKSLYLHQSLSKSLDSIAERYQPKERIEKIELKKESSISELKDQAVKYLIDGLKSQASQIVDLIRRRNELSGKFDISAAYSKKLKTDIVDQIEKDQLQAYLAISVIEIALGKNEIYADAYARQIIIHKTSAEYACLYAEIYEKQIKDSYPSEYASAYAKIYIEQITNHKRKEYANAYADKIASGEPSYIASEYATAYMEQITNNMSKEYASAYADKIASGLPSYIASDYADSFEVFYNDYKKEGKNHNQAIKYASQKAEEKVKDFCNNYLKKINEGESRDYASLYAAAYETQKELGKEDFYAENYANLYARLQLTEDRDIKYATRCASVYAEQMKLGKDMKFAEEYAKSYLSAINLNYDSKDAETYARAYTNQKIIGNKSHEYALVYAEQMKLGKNAKFAEEYAKSYLSAIDFNYNSKDAETYARAYTNQKIIGNKSHEYASVYAEQIAKHKKTPVIAKEIAEIYLEQRELGKSSDYATIYTTLVVNKSNTRTAVELAEIYCQQKELGKSPEYAIVYAEQIVILKYTANDAAAFAALFQEQIGLGKSRDYSLAYVKAILKYNDNPQDAVDHAEQVEMLKRDGKYTAEYVEIYDQQRELGKSDIYASVYVEQILEYKVDPKTAAEFAARFEQHQPPEKSHDSTSSYPVGVLSGELKGDKHNTEDSKGRSPVVQETPQQGEAKSDGPNPSDRPSFVERLAKQPLRSNRSI